MFKIKYGPETLNEFEDFDTAVDELIFQRVENPDLRLYILDTDSDSRFDIEDVEDVNPRFDIEDVEDVNPRWNEHLEI